MNIDNIAAETSQLGYKNETSIALPDQAMFPHFRSEREGVGSPGAAGPPAPHPACPSACSAARGVTSSLKLDISWFSTQILWDMAVTTSFIRAQRKLPKSRLD